MTFSQKTRQNNTHIFSEKIKKYGVLHQTDIVILCDGLFCLMAFLFNAKKNNYLLIHYEKSFVAFRK